MWPEDEILERLENEGYDSLSSAEKGYFALNMMVADVCNGGFRQYFYNYTGNYAFDAIRMLEVVGDPLADVKDVLMKAMSVLPSPYSTNNIERRKQIARLNDVQLGVLHELEQTVFDYSVDAGIELYEWAAEHEDQFPGQV